MEQQQQKHTIILGGVWADWSARVEAAEARAQAAEDGEATFRHRYDALSVEKDALLHDYHTLAHSLTATQLQDKNNQEILHIIREEKYNLEQRTAGLESQRTWQESLLCQLREQCVALEESLEESLAREGALTRQRQQLQQSLESTTATLARSESTCEQLRRTLTARATQIDSLQHNLDTKARQLAVLCKERDRLRSENAALSKATPRRSLRPASPAADKENFNSLPASLAAVAPATAAAAAKASTAFMVTPMTPMSAFPPQSPAAAYSKASPQLTADKLGWLLDGPESPLVASQSCSPAKTAPASRANIGDILKKIAGSPVYRGRKVVSPSA